MTDQAHIETKFLETMQNYLVDGKLPAYAWPGGYDIVYWTVDMYGRDGDDVCSDCANLFIESRNTGSEFGYYVVASHITDSDEQPTQCAHCYKFVGPKSEEEEETNTSSKCDQCDSVTINGIYTHEYGCPNRSNNND